MVVVFAPAWAVSSDIRGSASHSGSTLVSAHCIGLFVACSRSKHVMLTADDA
jgi:hypothetical protein